MGAMATEPVCPKCGGTGWIIVERSAVSGAEPCGCRFEGRAARIEERSQIPPLYRNASFDNFVLPSDNPLARTQLSTIMVTVRNYARDFPDDARPGLFLVGEPGTGKTHLAVAALRRIIEKGFEGLFCDYQNLLDRIRSGYDAASNSSDKEAYRVALDAEASSSTISAPTASPTGSKTPSPRSSPTAATTGNRSSPPPISPIPMPAATWCSAPRSAPNTAAPLPSTSARAPARASSRCAPSCACPR